LPLLVEDDEEEEDEEDKKEDEEEEEEEEEGEVKDVVEVAWFKSSRRFSERSEVKRRKLARMFF
jgi:Na+-transporting methylmalonyl-CoA/oxaloacetate decarboxylase gamma subunit